MKIAILSLPFNNNYGGYLQAYALQKTLESLGHKVEILNRRSAKINTKTHIQNVVMCMLRSIKHQCLYPLNTYKHKGKNMLRFVRKYMHLSAILGCDEDLYDYCDRAHFDAIVVGSDQIWRPNYVPNVENYFLGFAEKDTIKISYAASFGSRDVVYDSLVAERCGDMLKKFDGISLRENEGIEVFKRYQWHTSGIRVVLDPTMLLYPNDYMKLIKNNGYNKNYTNTVLAYVLDMDEKANKILHKVSECKNMPIKHIIDPYKWKRVNNVMPGIEEWLLAFSSAGAIVTDSFHGTVFSILFHKPFVCIVNKSRGLDRFTTLLSHFNLLDRLVTDENSTSVEIYKPIDWTSVDMVLNKKRSESINFLTQVLQH